MITQKKDGSDIMAKAKRQSSNNNYITLGIRVLILFIITLMLAGSARKKLEGVVTDEQYPTAAEQYTKLKQKKGSIRSLSTMFSGEGESADENTEGKLSKLYSNKQEFAAVKLSAPAEVPEETEQPKSGGMGGILVVLLVLAVGGGAALWYFKLRKPKASGKGDDLDEFDFDDDEDDADEFERKSDVPNLFDEEDDE